MTDLIVEKKEFGEGEKFKWIKLFGDYSDVKSYLKTNENIDDYSIDVLTDENPVVTVGEEKDSLIVIVRGIDFNDELNLGSMLSVRIYIKDNKVITAQKRKVRAVEDLENMISANNSIKTIGVFLAKLIGKLCDRVDNKLLEISTKLEDIEEKVIDNPKEEYRQDLLDIRKAVINLRKHLIPQKDVLLTLCDDDNKVFNHDDIRSLTFSYKKVSRYVDDLNTYNEQFSIVQDELQNSLSEKTNRNTYFLSVLATTFIPAGFLTGLFGINVGGLPLANNPDGFVIFVIVLFCMILIQTVIFRLLKLY
jgi:zinc transporter